MILDQELICYDPATKSVCPYCGSQLMWKTMGEANWYCHDCCKESLMSVIVATNGIFPTYQRMPNKKENMDHEV